MESSERKDKPFNFFSGCDVVKWKEELQKGYQWKTPLLKQPSFGAFYWDILIVGMKASLMGLDYYLRLHLTLSRSVFLINNFCHFFGIGRCPLCISSIISMTLSLCTTFIPLWLIFKSLFKSPYLIYIHFQASKHIYSGVFLDFHFHRIVDEQVKYGNSLSTKNISLSGIKMAKPPFQHSVVHFLCLIYHAALTLELMCYIFRSFQGLYCIPPPRRWCPSYFVTTCRH